MDITFVTNGQTRTEVEKAPRPLDAWWRARVVGGRRWRVPKLLPWSYGQSKKAAAEAALSLWASAGQPGFREVTAEARHLAADTVVPLWLAARKDEAAVTLVALTPGDADSVEYRVREPIEEVVRTVAAALEVQVSILALMKPDRPAVEVPIGSVIELRGLDPRGTSISSPAESERALVASEPDRATRSASP